MRSRFALSAVLALLPAIAAAEDWPQFRGPNASGVSAEGKPLPTEFSLEKNLRWSVKLGDGIGSPIVVGGKVCHGHDRRREARRLCVRCRQRQRDLEERVRHG
jgi:hypothetical protein